MPNALADTSIDRLPVSGRWIGLLIVSILLHVITFGWVGGNIAMPALPELAPPVITAQLRLAQPETQPVVPLPAPVKPEPAIRKKPKPTSRPRPAIAPPAPPAFAAAVDAPAVPDTDTAAPTAESVAPAEETIPLPPAAIEAPGASADPAAVLPPATAVDAAATLPPEPESAHYHVLLPPSVELKYDVQALREGQMVYGHGNIDWHADGANYTINGGAGILFFSVLDFASSGVIDDFGVAPVLYAEKRFRKAETNTHFHRERNTISFSASTAAYPRKGGEQDRASIIWQLSGIGRGDTGKFVPGAEIDLFVAGVRDAEIWRIKVIGEEDIETGSGKARAWHLMRMPRAGSYDQQLDIWLAPQQQWYPVKLRYTETNGDYLDMSVSNLTMAAAD